MKMTQSTLDIRPAKPADAATIAAFNAAMAIETEAKVLDEALLRAGVEAVLADSGRGFYLVAENAGRVVACLMITHEWSDWRNGDWWWLQSVYVDPGHRRRGVFQAMHAQVLRLAHATVGVIGLRLYVERDNATAQRTYSELGMQQTHYHVYEDEFERR